MFSLDPQFVLKCFCKSQTWEGAPRPADFPHPTLVASARIGSGLSVRLMLVALAGQDTKLPGSDILP